jgi:hypothetical protein
LLYVASIELVIIRNFMWRNLTRPKKVGSMYGIVTTRTVTAVVSGGRV